VAYGGQHGTIVFVVPRGEYSTQFPAKDWAHHHSGFMVRFDNSALLLLEDGDEHLKLIGRNSLTSTP
jgi:hypothetical protein